MRTVSIFGYSNSGKTTVSEAIVAEASRRGLRSAAIKVGRHETGGPEDSRAASQESDTDRLAAAGARITAFRNAPGWIMYTRDPHLPDRETPLALPSWLRHHLESEQIDILVVEGRRLAGAPVVQTIGADGRQKIPTEECDLILENVPNDSLPSKLVEIVFGDAHVQMKEKPMSGKHRDNDNTRRKRNDRQITLKIDGKPVDLNGFVQDAFQEVVIGLVRSLGNENEHGSIEISIAPDVSPEKPGETV